MNNSLKTIIYIIALFLAGAATGGIVGACTAKRMMFLHPPRPHDLAEQMRSQLQSRLNLTAEQKKKIDPILDQTDTQLKAIHLETMSKVSQIIDQTHAKIAAELTPDQQAKLVQLEKERREFLNRRPHGPFGEHRNFRHPNPDDAQGREHPPEPPPGPDGPPGEEHPPGQ